MKLLCTDLDRTLLPNGEQIESTLARPILWHLLAAHDVQLAYVSGRDLERVLRAVDDFNLKLPDFIVADVGSTIYMPNEHGWTSQEEWQLLIGKDWNGLEGEGVKALLQSVDGLREQEDNRQNRFKCSYYFSIDADRDRLKRVVEGRLNPQGIRASLVISDDPERHVGLLDVVPKCAGKVYAVDYLQNFLGLRPSDILFAGDSGNDVSALASHFPSVTVANADDDVRKAVRELALSNGTSDSTYQAQGRFPVADAQALNGNYAAGIVEGIAHFQPGWRSELLSAEWLAKAISLYDSANDGRASKSA